MLADLQPASKFSQSHVMLMQSLSYCTEVFFLFTTFQIISLMALESSNPSRGSSCQSSFCYEIILTLTDMLLLLLSDMFHLKCCAGKRECPRVCICIACKIVISENLGRRWYATALDLAFCWLTTSTQLLFSLFPPPKWKPQGRDVFFDLYCFSFFFFLFSKMASVY